MKTKTDAEVLADFECVTAKHEMTVVVDDPVRHIRYATPGTCVGAFELTTTPGRLIYAGDYGAYVFRRSDDMFSFFRGNVNYDYWRSKLEAVDDEDGAEEYSVALFREALESYREDFNEEIREFVDFAIATFEEDPERAVRLVYDYSEYDFADFFESSLKTPTFRFRWACHAIHWGVRQYDARTRTV